MKLLVEGGCWVQWSLVGNLACAQSGCAAGGEGTACSARLRWSSLQAARKVHALDGAK